MLTSPSNDGKDNDTVTENSKPSARTTPTFTAHLSPSIEAGPGRWEIHVLPLLEGVRKVRWLEIGSHEGRSALWVVDHLMIGRPDSTIICVDPWDNIWMRPNAQEPIFDKNTRGVPEILKCKGWSRDLLPGLPSQHFHGIYVDGSHTYEDAFVDGVMAAEILKPGGVLIFDDYEALNNDGTPRNLKIYGVYKAVEKLRAEWGDAFRPLWLGYQAIFQKTP